MKVLSLLVAPLLYHLLGLSGLNVQAQADASPPVQEIIDRFTAAEAQNKKARISYKYTQDYAMVELDANNSEIGGFNRISDVVYDDRARPVEKILYYPPPTMPNVIVTNEDMQDALGIQPFALTSADLSKYSIDYVKREQVAERSTYVFDVKPKHLSPGERYFEGRIWVDARDLQIFKVAGQAVPETSDQRFPHFETYREKIDGNYWFPVYTSADDVLKFRKSPHAHIRMTIRYSSYKKFRADICIRGDVEDGKCEELLAVKNESPGNRSDDELVKAYHLQEVVRQLKGEGKYREAIPHAERMLAIYEGVLGPNHRYVASTLNELADMYWGLQDYTRAEHLLRRVLDIQEFLLGRDHPNLVGPLGRLMELYYAAGQYEKAEPLLARWLPVIEKARGAGRSVTDLSLSSIGGLFLPREEYGRIEQVFLKTLNIKEQVAGKDSPELLNLYLWLGRLYIATGEYAKGESSLLHAQAILEKIPAPEPDKVAYVCNNLGAIHLLKAEYPEAENLFQRATTILQTGSGPQRDAALAATFNNLGMLHYAKGDFDEAEHDFQSARQLTEQAFGTGDVRVALFLNQLGMLYYTRGNYRKAHQFLEQASDMMKARLGEKHPDLAYPYSNLGALYCAEGDYVKAENLLRLALSIKKDAVGEEHIELTPILNNLAVLEASEGDYANAELDLKRALAIQEKVLPRDHASIGITLNQLAVFYISNEKYELAREPLERSLAILEKSLGAGDRNVGIARITLAALYAEDEDYVKAEEQFRRALDILEKTEPGSIYVGSIYDNLASLSFLKKEFTRAESELQKALSNLEEGPGPNQPNVATILHNLAIANEGQGRVEQAIDFSKRAVSISEYNLARNIIVGSERQKLLYLATLSDELDRVISLNVRSAPRNPLAIRLALTTLLQRKGRALDVMTDSIGALRRHTLPNSSLASKFDALLDACSRYAALVLAGPGDENDAASQPEDVRDLEKRIDGLWKDLAAHSVEFQAQSESATLEAVQAAIPQDAALIEFLSYNPADVKTRELDSPHYVAYILKHRGEPDWVDLGTTEKIDADVVRFLGSLRGNQPDIRQRARGLDEKIMRPVRRRLGNKLKRLLISPDAELNLIPFAALVDEDQHYLVENYSITYLTSGRDLLRLRNSLPNRQGPLIVANPNFDLTEKAGGAETQTGSDQGGRRRSRSGPLHFGPLDEAAVEAAELYRVLKGAERLSGDQATVAAVKRVHGPSILHLVTHGFFLEDQRRRPRGLQEVIWGGNTSPTAVALDENPLLRSGLALAGANLPQNRGGEDGILTALEMAGLDLWGTKLVVLSACETGLGDVHHGEGVFGLRRALVLAGAESQVMSLWRDNDEATRVLMVKYYTRLASGEGRGESLRQVQLEMLSSKQYSHPYFWAGFIQSGDWRSLSGK
jgi:CHAT domain-containing protein/Tfp pilus assembly protein PilF